MPSLSRRAFLARSVAATAAIAATDAFGLDADNREGVTFSFGTYGMKSLRTERAVRVIAEIGYDGVELVARPEWDSAPARMPSARRKAMRALMNDVDLQLTALMVSIKPTDDDTEHAAQLESFNRAIELGHDLSPKETPVVQTIFGGGKWDEKKSMLLKRVADWAKLAERQNAVICIKPHRGGVMSKPSEAVWLIEQLGDTPWLRMVYDYSHYAFRNMTIEATVKTSLAYTGHIAIKDTIRKGDGTTFVLPGESGTFDYEKLFTLFDTGGYRGDICCEVSGAVWGKPGYNAVAAAKTCYQNIAPILEKARISRRTSRRG
jgi:inosose dehydratase